MPGFNQRGPMNQGPMTGRRMGICTNGGTTGATGFTGAGTAGPMEFGQRRGMGRRAGQGFGGGRGFAQWSMPVAAPPINRETDLKQRADTLQSELNAIREELKNFSDSSDS